LEHERSTWFGSGSTFMTPSIVLALLAATVIVGIGVGFTKLTAAARGRSGLAGAGEVGSPDEAQAVDGSTYEVALSCRIGGHAYLPYDTGWRCATCGNHVARGEGELYGPAGEGRHERRRGPR
jgi:hypothetical protein